MKLRKPDANSELRFLVVIVDKGGAVELEWHESERSAEQFAEEIDDDPPCDVYVLRLLKQNEGSEGSQ